MSVAFKVKMKFDETTVETLQQDITEETGTCLKNQALLDVQTVQARAKKKGIDYHIIALIYKGRLSNDNVKISAEHNAFKWVPLEHLVKERFDLDAKRLIKLYKQK